MSVYFSCFVQVGTPFKSSIDRALCRGEAQRRLYLVLASCSELFLSSGGRAVRGVDWKWQLYLLIITPMGSTPIPSVNGSEVVVDGSRIPWKVWHLRLIVSFPNPTENTPLNPPQPTARQIGPDPNPQAPTDTTMNQNIFATPPNAPYTRRV